MTEKFLKKTGKIIFLLLVTNIIALFIIASVPLVYETISADQPDFWIMGSPVAKKTVIDNASEYNQSEIKTRLHYNFYTMQKRDTSDFKELSGEVIMINYFLWGGLILGVISFIGLVLYSTGKFPKKSTAILLVGFFMIIFSILNLQRILSLVDTVNGYTYINFSALWKPDSNIYYIYLLYLTSFVSITGSTIYVGRVGFHFLNKQRETMRQQKYEKIISREYDAIEKKPVLDTSYKRKDFFGSPEKKIESSDQKTLGLDKSKIGIVPIVDEKISSKQRDVVSSNESLKNGDTRDLSEKKSEVERESFFGEEVKTESTVKDSSSYDDVNKDVFKSQDNEDKTLIAEQKKIRCPKCKNVFEVSKKPGEVLHIKCPHCGQEGVLKK